MMTTTKTDMTIANTILEQLGGNKFRAMTGAKDFIGTEDALRFRLPRGAKGGINKVEVKLDPSDTYTVTFYKAGRAPAFRLDVVKALEGVYCDQLQAVFTEATGLFTRLF